MYFSPGPAQCNLDFLLIFDDPLKFPKFLAICDQPIAATPGTCLPRNHRQNIVRTPQVTGVAGSLAL